MYSDVHLVAPPLMEFPIFSFLHRPRSPLYLGFTRFPCFFLFLPRQSFLASVRSLDRFSNFFPPFACLPLNVCPTSTPLVRETCLDVVFNPLIHFGGQNQSARIILSQHTQVHLFRGVILLRALCHCNTIHIYILFHNMRFIRSIIF